MKVVTRLREPAGRYAIWSFRGSITEFLEREKIRGGSKMLGPMISGILLSIIMIAISLRKPNAGRIVFGIFFLVMAIGVNGTITLTNPQLYVDYGQDALLVLYRELCSNIIALNPVIFGLLLIIYEITIGLLMLSKGLYVKLGLLGSIFFLIAISPVSLIQIPWLALAIAPAYLLTKDFDITFWNLVKSMLQKNPHNHVH